MRRWLVIAGAMLALAGPAHADTIDVLKANTLALHQPGGGTMVLLVGEGGEMEQVNTRGMWAAGHWAIREGSFCWTARGQAQLCIPLPADKATGDSWEIHGPTGRHVWTAEIQPGRVDLEAFAAGIRAAEALDQAAGETSGQ